MYKFNIHPIKIICEFKFEFILIINLTILDNDYFNMASKQHARLEILGIHWDDS